MVARCSVSRHVPFPSNNAVLDPPGLLTVTYGVGCVQVIPCGPQKWSHGDGWIKARKQRGHHDSALAVLWLRPFIPRIDLEVMDVIAEPLEMRQIGRASCRERVE